MWWTSCSRAWLWSPARSAGSGTPRTQKRTVGGGADSGRVGWVSTRFLACNFPLETLPAPYEVPATPRPTPNYAATAAAATAIAVANPPINITVDRPRIKAGECTELRWDIQNVQAVYLDGKGVDGVDHEQVCPRLITQYTWKIVKRNGETIVEQRVVTVDGPAVVYDFIENATYASWRSLPSEETLPWDGNDTDTLGYVKVRENYLLEDGSRPERVLQTHPKMVQNGGIYGDFPLPSPAQQGDVFRAEVGFLAEGGDGQVQFWVYETPRYEIHGYRDTGSDRQLKSISIPLHAGVTRITLQVLADGSSDKDWAVWVNPRIERQSVEVCKLAERPPAGRATLDREVAMTTGALDRGAKPAKGTKGHAPRRYALGQGFRGVRIRHTSQDLHAGGLFKARAGAADTTPDGRERLDRGLVPPPRTFAARRHISSRNRLPCRGRHRGIH